MNRLLLTLIALALVACDDGAGDPDAGARDAAVQTDAGHDPCEGFVVPERPDTSACGSVSADDPAALAECLVGSGHAGRWRVDDDGLPAYDLEVEQRCDPAAHAYTPRPQGLSDPVLHLVGNGRGLMAMAHASGAVEVYSQDRGHAWLNHVDTWRDRRDPSYPPQIGGGFGYVVEGDAVRSTRYDDLPIESARTTQTRRFGVGYVETVTTLGDLVVRRRVFAPESDARALVAEVTLESTSDAARDLAWVELWDVNQHQVAVELATSDLAIAGTTEGIDRRRRARQAGFEHRVRWDPSARVMRVETSATSLPAGVDDRLDPSEVDAFPDPIYLAALDDGPAPDAVWLTHDELFDGLDRGPPANAALPGHDAARDETIGGEGSPVALAMRVPVSLPARGSVSLRFAFGYVPGGGDETEAVASLRDDPSSLFAATRDAWRARMIWAAFEGFPDAGPLQRELAWSSYYAIANASYDESRHTRVEGQGGSYRFIHGLDGAIGDLCLFADALLFVEPTLARDTLVYVMATQHGSTSETPWRFPYATTGVGTFSDVGIYGMRSDAYWLLPSSVGRYVAATRDESFLDREVPYWPEQDGERGDAIDHVRRALEYAETTLGYGARGLPAMGTNDYADGVLQLSEEPATPAGTSSTFNALFIAHGFPLAEQVVLLRDTELALRMRTIRGEQVVLIENEAWTGTSYTRGFVDSGAPLAPQYLFVEPQVLPILAGLVPDDRRDALLDLVERRFETPLGAMTTVEVGEGGPIGGPDMPQIGGVWPVASAWVTEAASRRDAALGWDSFVRNTLFTHAELYPDVWYGIWSGPDSYNGPDHPRAGEADAHLATALTDFPVLNVHAHLGPIRSLVGVLGVSPTAAGLAIRPRIPGERWSVRLPRLHLDADVDRFAGRVFASVAAPVTMEVRALPPGVGASVTVTSDGATVPSTRDGDEVVFELSVGDDGTPFDITW
ncbi:MAG: hypothetical protein AB7S26_26265 [Sandaracinaceae bacterium]